VRGYSDGLPMTCDPFSPTVTARARPGPAVPGAVRTQRGPGSRAWKARPGGPFTPDTSPMALLSDPMTDRCCPWGGPSGTVATGTRRARPAGTTLADRGGDGHKLNWRVRLVLGDYLPRWQASKRRPGGRLMAPFVMARFWRAGACCGSPNGRAGLVRGSHTG
jgi:hypothetical protein